MDYLTPTLRVITTQGGQFTLLEQNSYQSVLYVGQLDAAVPSYASGTRILTHRGEIPVEALAVGDRAMTLLGQGFAPVTWIGSRTLRPATHPDPDSVSPIRIRKDAFGPDRPHRDLVVSPGHGLFIDGVLIQAEMLVNDQSVVRENVSNVTYWHVEVEHHDILLAEGLPAESYLDVGNRAGFSRTSGTTTLHPRLDGDADRQACAPIVREGEVLTAVRRRLLDRAAQVCDVRRSSSARLRVVADEQVVHAASVAGDIQRFMLPEGCGTVRLLSRTWCPAHVDASSHDFRRLGVCVRRVVMDGCEVPLTTLAGRRGWHEAESSENDAWCWTSGNADLPGGRSVEILVGGNPTYLCKDQDAPGDTAAAA